jgi:hypothetical protein
MALPPGLVFRLRDMPQSLRLVAALCNVKIKMLQRLHYVH